MPGFTAEDGCEVALRGEAAAQCDFAQGAWAGQQGFCPFDLVVAQALGEGFAGGDFVEASEVAGADAEILRQHRDACGALLDA